METHEYSNGEITILWKPQLCTHSGICVKTLPQVYDPKARPWVKPHQATTEQLRHQVGLCPSGALSIKNESAIKEEISEPKTEKTEIPSRPKKYALDKPIKGTIGIDRFQSSIKWRNGTLITDEPHRIGGGDLGPDPYTLLLSSLVSCTLATLRMYIDHKDMDIPEVEVTANLAQKIKANGESTTTIDRQISFGNNPPEPEVQNKLREVAENCPISKILKGQIFIENHPIF